MTPAYVAKLGLKIWATIVEDHKIDAFIFQTFEMVLTNF